MDVFGGEGREKYFSRPSRSPLPPRAIIPAARPLGTFENRDTRDGKTRYMKGSHEKIRDREQSNVIQNNFGFWIHCRWNWTLDFTRQQEF